jgi:hypothetical protein
VTEKIEFDPAKRAADFEALARIHLAAFRTIAGCLEDAEKLPRDKRGAAKEMIATARRLAVEMRDLPLPDGMEV